MKEEMDIKDPDIKSKFYQNVARKLLEFRDELERNVYIDAVVEEYMIPRDSLIKSISTMSLTLGEEDIKVSTNRDEYRKTKDDSARMALKTLLTWLIDDKSLYGKIKNIITVEDFILPLYHTVAQMLFEQLEASEINPAKIINHFEDGEEQSEVAGLFSVSVDEQLTSAEREKTLNDILYNVKKNSIEHRSSVVTDVLTLQKLIKEKNELNKIHVTL
jgi:DNA primase